MNKRKHIVIDARIRRTSTGRYADRLVEHLQTVDTYHRYTVLVQPDDPWKPHNRNFRVAPCSFPQFSVNPLHDIRFAIQLYGLKADLVHFTMTQQPLLYFGKITTFSHDTTMYRFVRRGTTPMPIYKLKMACYRFLVWWSHRKSAKVLVPTQTVAKEFGALQPFVQPKLVVTYEASEPPLPVKAERPLSVDASERFILYVGTAFPHKNLQGLITIFNQVHQKDPALKLVLVGKHEKHYFELMEWATSQSSYQNIVFTGFVSDAELKWLYRHCQAYVFASLSEGFGLPPLEAMAHGAPVISSNLSCMPEVYGDAAYYFDPHKPEEGAQAIQKVLGNVSLRKDLIARGREQLKHYSWQHMANETLTVFKEVLDETTET